VGANECGGRLLVALPALDDPNFERSVVLILEHDEDGALGLVLNRPTTTPIDEVLEGWSALAAAPANLFGGGPVEPRAVVGLAVARPDAGSGITIVGRIRTIDPTGDPSLLTGEVEGARIFAGYAGWGPGQLEDELAQGAWLVVDAEPNDVVSASPDALWHDVMGRQPGAASLMATYPDDPRLN
jgi:putative transcriptional regulator